MDRRRRTQPIADYNPHLGTKEDVVRKHGGLVHMVAKRFVAAAEKLRVPYDDLISVGFMGLLFAFEKFDPNKSAFTTYATSRIQGEIQRYLRDHSFLIRRPRWEKNYRYYIQSLEGLFHTKDNQDREGTGINLERMVGVEHDPTEIEVSSFLESLPPRLQETVQLRMNGWTQQEIGQRFGVSQVTVSRWLAKAREMYRAMGA